ncbi:MAG TPA: hypothetical protein VF042_09125 [Gemmatimonadaceae bacterium]
MQMSADAGLALLVLGAAHGINPAMGWLFAVGRGLQERSRRAVWTALGPLAVGHAMAIAAAVLLATTLGKMVPLNVLRSIVALALFAVGADGLIRHRHVCLSGMRVSARELTTWSFLMASAHGAGLMVLPFMLGSLESSAVSARSHHHMMSMAGMQSHAAGAVTSSSAGPIGFAAPLIHTAGYLLVTGLLAVVVYEKVGLRILRRAWINLNVIWSVAMIGTGVLAMLI